MRLNFYFTIILQYLFYQFPRRILQFKKDTRYISLKVKSKAAFKILSGFLIDSYFTNKVFIILPSIKNIIKQKIFKFNLFN